MTPQPADFTVHSPAWIFQTWASFVVSIATTSAGIAYLPTDPWMKGFLAMGRLFTIGSTFSLAKTVRDIHEARKAGPGYDYRHEKSLG